jgi:PadR family transcriptional regulator PadR
MSPKFRYTVDAALQLTFHTRWSTIPVVFPQERSVKDKLDILQGTLDLMVLRTLSTLGPLHGYGIARRIEQVSGDQVILNQGTIYTSLVRLQQRGWIRSRWGTSENNRRARYYVITRAGEKQLVAQTEYWERLAAVMGRVLASERSEG